MHIFPDVCLPVSKTKTRTKTNYIYVCIEVREMCDECRGSTTMLFVLFRAFGHPRANTQVSTHMCMTRCEKLITQCSHDKTDFNPNAHTHTVTDRRVLMYKIHIDAFIFPTLCVLMKKKTRRLDEERY